MEVVEARRLLAVDSTAAADEIERAFATRLEALQVRTASAPTASLKAKFERQVDELKAAYAALSGGDQGGDQEHHDLPVARPSAGSSTGSSTGPPPRAAEPDLGPAPATGARYRLGDTICDSAFAATYRATDLTTREEVVICLAKAGWDPPAAFEAVAEAWRRLGPPGAELDFTAGELDRRAYLAFRAADGGLLRADIEAARKVRRLKPVEPACAAAAMLARRVGAALRHLRVTDLKPEAIWRTAQGQLIPLGFAPALDEAPSGDGREQAAVAGVLWELLTNRAAEEETSIRKVRPEIPPLAAKVLERALAASPDRRHASLEAFANGLSGEAQGLALASGVTAHLPQLSRPQMLGAAAGAVAIVALVATYSSWKSLAPWQVIFDKQEATRLAGVVKSLTEHADGQMNKVTQEAAAAAAAADGLQEKLQGNGGVAYDDYLPRYIEAAVRKARTETVRARFEAAAATDLEAAPLRLAEATDLLSAGDNRHALEQLKALQTKYVAIAALPGQIRHTIAAQEQAATARLAGDWAAGDCAKASHWRLDGSSLNVVWPDQGAYQERVVGYDDGVVYTIGVLPQTYAGHIYGYTVDGQSLIVEAMGKHASKMTLKRCS